MSRSWRRFWSIGNILLAASVIGNVGLAHAGAQAAPGSLDITFDGDGIVTDNPGYYLNVGFSTEIQQDGKIVVGGYVNIPLANVTSGTYADENRQFALIRFTPAGKLDSTFGSNGRVITDFGATDESIKDVAIQVDGKILVAGYTRRLNRQGYNYTVWAVARYNANGTLDSTFGDKGKVITTIGDIGEASKILQLSDGKILVGGKSGTAADYYFDDFTMAKYNSDGTLDSAFGTGGVVVVNISDYINNISTWRHDYISDLAIQTDGKIIAVGAATQDISPSIGGGYKDNFAVVRFNSNGTLDPTFNGNGIVTTAYGGVYTYDQASGVALQADGKIVVGGVADRHGKNAFAVARYNIDGTLDPSFGTDGKTTTPIGIYTNASYSLKLQKDGKIILGGIAYQEVRLDGVVGSYPHMAVARYDVTGRLDSRFGNRGIVLTFIPRDGASAADLAIQADGKIVAVGSRSVYYNNTYYSGGDFAVARYNP